MSRKTRNIYYGYGWNSSETYIHNVFARYMINMSAWTGRTMYFNWKKYSWYKEAIIKGFNKAFNRFSIFSINKQNRVGIMNLKIKQLCGG